VNAGGPDRAPPQWLPIAAMSITPTKSWLSASAAGDNLAMLLFADIAYKCVGNETETSDQMSDAFLSR
jgi:hypothetical protein